MRILDWWFRSAGWREHRAFDLLPIIINLTCSGGGFPFPSQDPLQSDCGTERGRGELVHGSYPLDRYLGAEQLDFPTHGHQQTDPAGEIKPPLGASA